ncbi:MAG: MFS transporter [Spirosomataceae bacterium]
MPTSSRTVLPVLVFAQFAGTSLWFAGNAVLTTLQQYLGLPVTSLSYITIAVQLGFITGTLGFALIALPDRIPSRWLFLISSLLGALCNASLLIASSLPEVLVGRFLTGICLAGIYPIGMKIAAEWFPQGLGKALGLLVGALVLGTAFPHLLRSYQDVLSWKQLMVGTSLLAIVGGFSLFVLIPATKGRATSSRFEVGGVFKAFQQSSFKSAAWGYFGHMWELYTFWAFLPLLLHYYNQQHPDASLAVSFWAFLIIAMGLLGCVVGGFWSERIGSVRVAYYALWVSGLCCLGLLGAVQLAPAGFIMFLLVWGFAVAADSPQLSSLVAGFAPADLKGTALTLSTCIGFSITIVSIQLCQWASTYLSLPVILTGLALGPMVSIVAIKKLTI